MANADTKIDRDLRNRILAEIAAHIGVYGKAQWHLIREQPEFSPFIGSEAGPSGKRKFFRWVNIVSEGAKPNKTRPHEGNEVAGAAMSEAAKRARLAATKNIPYPPSPAYMLRAGAEGERKVNFLAEFHLLMEDAYRLRELAIKDDGEIDFKDWDAAIRTRLKVMVQVSAIWNEVYDLEDFKRYYDLIADMIIEEVGEHPDIQDRIIQRLQELNDARGMTIYATPA